MQRVVPPDPHFSPIETLRPRRARCGKVARIQHLHHGDIRIDALIYALGECEMKLYRKQYRKRFIKDVIVEVTILSALIVVLLAFLDPG